MMVRVGVGVVVSIVLAWVQGAAAQDATGHVAGQVVTPDARPVASVRVSITGPSLQGSREAETDLRGYFRLQELPVGTYQVRLALVGYRPIRFDHVSVRLGLTTSLGQTSLVAQAYELGEIVVNAEQPIVDVASAATVVSLPSEFFSYLPTERSFGSIVGLAPQADQSRFPGEQVNIAGSSGPENAYYLDGVNISRLRFGTGSTDLPYNFIREVQIKTGGYEAEFGRSTGGIIDVITHSGGNQFGGQVFGYFTDNALKAEPRFAIPGARQGDFSDYDLGGSVGGPILRNRLWFFAAYNPNFHRERVEVLSANIPDDHTTEHLFAAKLTWRAAPQTDVIVTAHGNPSRHQGVDLGRALDTIAEAEAVSFLERQGGLQLSALVRHRMGRNGQVELGVSRFTLRFRFDDAAGRTDPHFADYTTGVVSGGYGNRVNNHALRAAVRGSVRQAFGGHAMKVGVEYENNRFDQANDYSAYPGSPQGFIERDDSTSYYWTRGSSGGLVYNRVLTAYAQDSWRSTDRLTLNYGVRWEAQYLIGPDEKLIQRFTDEWQPRVGFTYQVGRLGSQKVFGSYGRFYEQIPLLLPATFYNPFHELQLHYDHDPRIEAGSADTVYDFEVKATDFQHPKSDLRGQSLDEFILGYERALGRQFRAGVRGVHRAIHWVLEDEYDSTGNFVLGNPGRGPLTTPRARRTYDALVISFEKPEGDHLSFLASYVLSRRRGNYEGLSFVGNPAPNFTPAFDNPELFPNSTGLLLNDHPHVFKLSGSYRFGFGLTAGTAIAWMSGSPRNEFRTATFSRGYQVFLQPRGSAGRTDALLDGSVRFTYALRPWRHGGVRPTVYLDVFHLGNRRTALNFDEVHYLEVDAAGNPTTPNPDYGQPLVFQEPMSARIGLSLDFGVLDEGDGGGY
jgi:hypothetical protein